MSDQEKDLCYGVSPYQRYLWRYRKLVDPSAHDAEKEGTKQYEAFPDFSGEVYHRLYSEQPNPLEEPEPGSEPYQKMHDQMGKLPELDDLAERCRGDEEWAGIGTGAIIDTILKEVDKKDDEQVEDPREDHDAMEIMQDMLEKSEEDEQKDAIRDTIGEIHEQIDGKQQKAQEAATLMDNSQVRNAIRGACQQAMKEIDDREKAYESFMAGSDMHSGKQARRQASKQIAKAMEGNDRLRRIAQLAGRLRRIAIEQQRQKPKRGTDEITGIELGDNLAKLVPVEALFTEPELEVIFAKRFFEKSLQQFELNRTPPKQQGPIVVLLDSSGSMEWNHADAWAAAVTLAFLEIARKQGRAFSIVHFGGQVLRVDEWAAKKNVPLQELLDAVSFFASDGGTNFQDPLDKGIEMIEKHGAFKDADIIMVTDGQAHVSDDWLRKFKQKRDRLGFSVYSVVIAVNQAMDDLTNQKFSDECVSLEEVLKDDQMMHKIFGRV
jgi:uncharacterized protein with von Willebrand factor type A (vWA) domain